MAAAGAILSLGLSWLLGHRLVTQDVSRIPSVLSQRQGGDETARTGLTSHDGELGEIGSSLDEYLTALQLARQAQQREEERRTLLMNEISHRMKNLLSTVQAVASQSFRNGRDTSESLNSFTSRLSAIAKAHQMLMFGEAAGHTTIEQALRSSIAIFDPHRFELSGPDLQLKPRATFSLAIATQALHECGQVWRPFGARGTCTHYLEREQLPGSDASDRVA